VIASDGREIVFAGAGILWGATTFVRGLLVRRAVGKISTAEASHTTMVAAPNKGTFSTSIVGGFILTLACIAYLAQSLIDSHR
jgi:hypothetical protein